MGEGQDDLLHARVIVPTWSKFLPSRVRSSSCRRFMGGLVEMATHKLGEELGPLGGACFELTQYGQPAVNADGPSQAVPKM